MKWYHITIGLLLMGCLLGLQECREHAADMFRMSQQVNGLLSQDTFNAYQIHYWQDEYGREHGAVQQLELSNGLLADSVRNLAKLIGKEPKQIEGATDVKATTVNDYSVHLQPLADGSSYFDYHTPYKHVYGTLHGDTLKVTDTSKIDIQLTYYWQRAHKLLWFRYGRIGHFVDAYSLDDSMRRVTVASMRVKPKKPGRIGIGPYVGIDLYGRPSVGMSIQYSLIRF